MRYRPSAVPDVPIAPIGIRLVVAVVVVAGLGLPGKGAASEPAAVRLVFADRTLEGTPVAWSPHRVLLLGTTGFLWDFDPAKVQNYEPVSSGFRPVDHRQMRGILLREFGKHYEVSGTGHYLVVHPAAQRDRWAPRFEELYRSFTRYFGARGLKIQAPEFPLVAIAFPTRDQFEQYVRASGIRLPGGVVGFYSMTTNRILLYDQGQGSDRAEHWRWTAETIIHEATHQIAFNTPVHSRVAPPPLWVAEGLAMMFEAPGIHDPRHHPRRSDRINQSRLAYFLRHRPTDRVGDQLVRMVGDPGRFFAANPGAAYAEAWAFTFFLSEKEPARFVQYLQTTAARIPLRTYSEADRRQEFSRVFGTDMKMLEARFHRFISELERDLQ